MKKSTFYLNLALFSGIMVSNWEKRSVFLLWQLTYDTEKARCLRGGREKVLSLV